MFMVTKLHHKMFFFKYTDPKNKIFITAVLYLFITSVPTLQAQAKVIHILTALCDNKNQGIVPVPAAIGNGQDPTKNLYWGAGFGIKTFFKKQTDWKLLKQISRPSAGILERLVFKHTKYDAYLVADAYDGAEIRQTTSDLLLYASGHKTCAVKVDELTLNGGKSADLLAYVGHNGFMDFSLSEYPKKADEKKRQVIILACASKNYFSAALRKTGAQPLLWTTNLMCPEAYTLDAVVDGWLRNKTNVEIREAAAAAYHKYQKCGLKGAKNLLVTGW